MGIINVGLDGTTLVPSDVTVMGPPSVSSAQLAGWYRWSAPPGWRATVSVDELAACFIEEGEAEGVRGDVAFCQGIIETGWYRWPSGSVTAAHNNFGGLGATDTNPAANRFPTARIGARAHMQHLRAYADPAAVCGPPCYDVRFDLVSPHGKAPLWNQFGFGIWASSRRTNPTYAESILMLFASLIAYRNAQP